MTQSQFRKSYKPKCTPSLPVIRPHTAGIDIGDRSTFVCVPSDSCATPVAEFGTFTDDLFAIAEWLTECKVISVALESTGIYWIPLFQILEDRGFDVMLVNTNYPKKPDKSDLADSQWLQYLHSVGLLDASFRPSGEVCALRSIMRVRETHIRSASSCIQRMQKAMTQMNLQLAHVITELSGVTGFAIIDSILAGERDPKTLAVLRDKRVKATAEQIEKALVGDYRDEHIFALGDAKAEFEFHRTRIAECDRQAAILIESFDTQAVSTPITTKPSSAKTRRNEICLPGLDLRSEMQRIFGVDLSAVPGIGVSSVHTILSEVGPDFSAFPTESHFASWLGLCPNNRVSGGKALSRHTRRTTSRVANTLRVCAQTLGRHESYLGHFYRKMRGRSGPAQAITATAHKLAKIVYHMVTKRQAYDESRFAKIQEQQEEKNFKRLQKQALNRGMQLVPLQ